MLPSCYLILLNLGPITVEPTVLCDGKDCAGEGLILPGFEPGLTWVAAGLGWWLWSRRVMAPGLWSLCRDSAEAGAGGCSCCVGSAAPVRRLGLGLSPPETHHLAPDPSPRGIGLARGLHPIFWANSSLVGEIPSTKKSGDAAEQHRTPPYESAPPDEFSGIRCLSIKLSRHGCVGRAKTFLCRSNIQQLMPVIENLMWSRGYF